MKIHAEESLSTTTTEMPLDSGPASFQELVPASRLVLPSLAKLKPRSEAQLHDFEAALASLPGQPVEVRKKFSNANPESLAIAKSARMIEWSRRFGLGKNSLRLCHTFLSRV